MELLNKDLIFKEIPLFTPLDSKHLTGFTNLSEEEQCLIKERSILKEYKKGQIIYKEGAPADAFYCVVLGRAVIYTSDASGNNTILEYLHRGKYFGMISLLTGEPHSVTAQAINDSVLLVIPKNDFNFILNRIPRLSIDLSQTLSRRLKDKGLHQKTIFETTIISVFSSYSQAGKTIYALNLALSLKLETHKSVVILDIAPKDKIHSLPRRLDIKGDYPVMDLDSSAALKDFILRDQFGIDLICASYKSEYESSIKRLLDILSLLVNDYHYIILDLPSIMNRFIFRILNQSDQIHILTSPEAVDLKRTHNLIKRLKTDFAFPESKVKIIINEYRLSKFTPQQELGLLGYSIFATLPKIESLTSDRLILDAPNCEYARAIRRICRRVGDCLVGLTLGVGMAYGFCHIGVLKVIEEEKIPIDVISGSSTGALIASLWAIGKSSQEILEIAKEFKEPRHIWAMVDLTFPLLGFIKGNKLHEFLKKYLDNKTFYDTRLPLKIIASDVKRKEPIVLDKGLLVDAIMATCAMPGVFRPFKFKEGMLLDGGVINPLPTEVLFKMGVKKIIAVNTTPSREDIVGQYEKIKERFSAEAIGRKRRFSLRQYFRDKFRTNILGIIFSSIEIMQSEVAKKEAQLADIVLHPDISGLHWLELHRAEDFAKRGEEETRRNLDKIWQIINE